MDEALGTELQGPRRAETWLCPSSLGTHRDRGEELRGRDQDGSHLPPPTSAMHTVEERESMEDAKMGVEGIAPAKTFSKLKSPRRLRKNGAKAKRWEGTVT